MTGSVIRATSFHLCRSGSTPRNSCSFFLVFLNKRLSLLIVFWFVARLLGETMYTYIQCYIEQWPLTADNSVRNLVSRAPRKWIKIITFISQATNQVYLLCFKSTTILCCENVIVMETVPMFQFWRQYYWLYTVPTAFSSTAVMELSSILLNYKLKQIFILFLALFISFNHCDFH